MVDAAATRDRDDAFAVTRVGSGWRVEVHVANVADVVPVAGTADARAFARRASTYRRSGTTPMLGPEVEAATTLVPGLDRRTVRFDIELDHAAAVTKTTLSRSWTQGRAAALTYTAAAAVLADPAAPLHAEVLAAQQLATLLLARRRAAGALAIYDLVHGLATTEEGNLIVLDDQERSNTYMVVAELMILANSVGAVWAAERELPILYRNHRANPVGAAADVVAAEIMAALDDPARLAGVRARLAVTIGRASYDPVVRGHHGLQLPLYTHLTSPLRRWPDLASQRVLLAALDHAPAPYRVDQMAALAADFNRRDTAARAATAAHHQARRPRRNPADSRGRPRSGRPGRWPLAQSLETCCRPHRRPTAGGRGPAAAPAGHPAGSGGAAARRRRLGRAAHRGVRHGPGRRAGVGAVGPVGVSATCWPDRRLQR